MNRLEDELRSALRRRNAPAGFADRVVAGIPSPSRGWRHSWMAVAAAGLIAILGGGGVYEYRRSERVRLEGERAKAELVFALELTAQKLQHTKAKVLKVSGEL